MFASNRFLGSYMLIFFLIRFNCGVHNESHDEKLPHGSVLVSCSTNGLLLYLICLCERFFF